MNITLGAMRRVMIVSACIGMAMGCGTSHEAGDGGNSADVDAGASTTDSGAAPIDAGEAPIDGGETPVDGGEAPVDGGEAPTDSGMMTPVDGGAPPADGGAPGVMCGGMTCAAGQECCIQWSGGATASCVEPGMCEGAVAMCDGPEDCGAGEACCASISAGTGGGGGFTVMCTNMCEGFLDREVCHTDADCSETGAHCCPYMDLGSVCQRRACR